MSDREKIVRETQARARAAKKAVYGFSSQKASCAKLGAKQEIPDEWDRIAVEGDTRWTWIERREAGGKAGAA